MFKSLRWRLQVWHAIVLLVVLTSFGGIVHSLHWQTRLQQIDAELARTAGLVRWQLWRNRFPSGGFRPGVRSQRDENDAGKSEPGKSEPGKIEAAKLETTTPPPPRRDRAEPDASSEEFQQLFSGDSSSDYYALWNGDGELIQKSASAPGVEYPNLHFGKDERPNLIFRSRNGYREVIQAGAGRKLSEINLIVGHSLDRALASHHRGGLLLCAAGTLILVAGVLGGGWLSARAIRPIVDMTATAEAISGENLSERIDVRETDTELGKLATVLNGTFDRLQLAFERQCQFTADASHELRTPLSVISAHAELALSRSRSNDEYRETIETCQRASQRMKSLIDSLLLLARFDSGTPTLKEDRLDLKPLLNECMGHVEPLAAERQIEIECRASSCHVVGDWDRLSQVFTNLLTNAIRYNVDGGRVEIATRTESGSAIISVSDTGVGIAADQLPRVFDRFYQVDKARSRAEGSCGLGLSICKTIVEMHGGSIKATSKLGEGTTIDVQLSLAHEQDPSRGFDSTDGQFASALANHSMNEMR